MQKLIYINQALTSAQNWLKTTDSNTRDWNNNNNIYYRSLVFTNDGHLLTHGLDFSTAASWGVGLIYNSSNGVTASAIPTGNDASGYFPIYTRSGSEGNYSIGVTWKKVSEILSSEFTGSTSITTVGTITTGTWNGSTIDVAHGGTGVGSLTSGQVLIGNGTNPVSTLGIDTTVTQNSNNLITSAAVHAAIAASFAANDAMVFKGTIGTAETTPTPTVTSLPTSGYSAGATYRVVTAGTYAGKVCEVGDLIIAIKDGPSSGSSVIDADWTVAQTNIDGALTTANLTTTSSNLKRHVFKDTDNYLYVNQILRKIQVGGVDKISETSTTALNFVNGDGIAITYDNGIKIAINNSVTAQSTSNLYKITHNAQGLITGSIAWDPSTITFANVYTSRTGSTLANAVNLFDPDGTAITIAAGEGLNFFKDGSNLKIGHSTTGASSVTAANRTYIKSLTIDTWGHITAVTTGTETVVNTWRPIYAYQLGENGTQSATQIRESSTGTKALSFGSDFLAKDVDTSNSDGTLPGSEIYLAWAEVDANGNVTYAI